MSKGSIAASVEKVLSILPDMVNAELVLGTIQTRQDGASGCCHIIFAFVVKDAVNWLGYTYLYAGR